MLHMSVCRVTRAAQCGHVTSAPRCEALDSAATKPCPHLGYFAIPCVFARLQRRRFLRSTGLDGPNLDEKRRPPRKVLLGNLRCLWSDSVTRR